MLKIWALMLGSTLIFAFVSWLFFSYLLGNPFGYSCQPVDPAQLKSDLLVRENGDVFLNGRCVGNNPNIYTALTKNKGALGTKVNPKP